ncbi:MAG: DNA cytosine methyltransferase [Blastocatellales bacterium]
MGKFAIVDLFAGPGGLAEGFAGFRDDSGKAPFEVAFSVEKEKSAHATLLLRSFLRQFDDQFPDEFYDFVRGRHSLDDFVAAYPDEWAMAHGEALNLELGTPAARGVIRKRLDQLDGRRTIVIGGPPCQAYSLVGRSRNRGQAGYVPEEDERHFLYQEYIGILVRLAPAAFVMENVKGLLSSTVNGGLIGEKILSDLRRTCRGYGGYRLFPLGGPDGRLLDEPELKDFVIRAERHGVPQARHRLIIVGVRADLCAKTDPAALVSLEEADDVTASAVLSSLPALRSGLSRGEDSFERWSAERLRQMRLVAKATAKSDRAVSAEAKRLIEAHSEFEKELKRSGSVRSKLPNRTPAALRDWIVDPRLANVPNHETRGHMTDDLGRYFFASVFAQVHGTSPKAGDFPAALAPDHANWKSGKFADRFRVQLADRPSTTITSHISKDGHYFIHPDPAQCRSLTVREAARLQTFPDNYVFLGNRTQQYVQVGNAVPPFLARQIARALHEALQRIDTMQTGAERRWLAS